jgi:PhnB protein
VSSKPQPIPDGYTTVTPWIILAGVDRFIRFITDTLGAEEIARVQNPDGTIGHAEARIGTAIVMMFDSLPGWPETPQFLRIYVDDSQAVYDRMIRAGCRSVTEPTLLAWGDRVGRVADPWANVWWIQERVEEVSEAEMGERWSDPKYAEPMVYVQGSLDEEMRRRGRSAP